MARQFRCEQRHRNGPRLDRCEESGDIVEALRREHRYPVTASGDLLQVRTDGSQSDTELGPGQFDSPSVRRAGVVQVAIRDAITDIRDVAVDERYQRDAWRHRDAALGIQAVLDL